MAAGVTDRLLEVSDLVALLGAEERRAERAAQMKIMREIAGALAGVVVLAIYLYFQWRHIQKHLLSIYSRNLGDGDIQTLFPKKRPK